MGDDFRQVLMLQKMRIFNRLRIQTFSIYVGFARTRGRKWVFSYRTKNFIRNQQIGRSKQMDAGPRNFRKAPQL